MHCVILYEHVCLYLSLPLPLLFSLYLYVCLFLTPISNVHYVLCFVNFVFLNFFCV